LTSCLAVLLLGGSAVRVVGVVVGLDSFWRECGIHDEQRYSDLHACALLTFHTGRAILAVRVFLALVTCCSYGITEFSMTL